MTPSAIIEAAIKLIQQRGWSQGALMDDAGGMCAVGAVWQVHIDGRCTPAEATAAVNVLDDFAVTCGYEWDEADDHPAFNYNDAEAQCMDHIVVFMRVAAFATESKPTELAVAA